MISANGNVKYETVMKALAALKAAGFQRIDVTEDADLSLPDASHSKSYAGYGAAAALF